MPRAKDSKRTEAARGVRRIFVRDLVLAGFIGVWKHEKGAPQRVRINLDLEVREAKRPIGDRLARVVNYDEIVTGVRRLVGSGHINLIETMAERIATLCLASPKVLVARVRVEKLDVYPDAASVGVEIERTRAGRAAP